MVNGSFGRSKGIYKWRKGWRADCLDGAPERRPPAMPATPSGALDAASGSRSGSGSGCGEIGGSGEISVGDTLVDAHVDAAWTWWREVLGSPRYVLAPMIGACDPPFRVLCRK